VLAWRRRPRFGRALAAAGAATLWLASLPIVANALVTALGGARPLAADAARQAVVIFLLRGYDQFGSTMIGVLDRYARTIQGNGGRLMLAGVSEDVLAQLERTGLLRLIGRENVFVAQPQWGAAANQALETAQAWLEALDPPEGRPE
jgi:MFS superfamily sulfate permease-like transporter